MGAAGVRCAAIELAKASGVRVNRRGIVGRKAQVPVVIKGADETLIYSRDTWTTAPAKRPSRRDSEAVGAARASMWSIERGRGAYAEPAWRALAWKALSGRRLPRCITKIPLN